MPLDDIRAWIGKTQAVEDFVAPWPAKALIATLDEADPEPRMGDPLPPLWHWLYFLEVGPQSKIGPDGHGERGEFLPPIDLPRRMWAGSRFRRHGVRHRPAHALGPARHVADRGARHRLSRGRQARRGGARPQAGPG